MTQKKSLSLLIVFFIFNALFMQNCFYGGDGTTIGDPLSSTPIDNDRAVGFSPYEDYLPEEDGDNSVRKLAKVEEGEFVKSVQICVESFYARGIDGTKYVASFIEEGGREVVLDPDGTFVGFLDDQNLPAGEYTASIKVSNRCGWWHRIEGERTHRAMMIFENSYGNFGWNKHGGWISDLKMSRHVVGGRRIWAAEVQGFIDTLAGIQSEDEITCAIEKWLPDCIPADPPGTPPHVKRLKFCMDYIRLTHEGGEFFDLGSRDQDVYLRADGTLDTYFLVFEDLPEGSYTANVTLTYGCGMRENNGNTGVILNNGHGTFALHEDGWMEPFDVSMSVGLDGQNHWRAAGLIPLYEASKDVTDQEEMICLFMPGEPECIDP